MKALKLTTENGEKNLNILHYNKFRCRFTKGVDIPDWRIVKVDEPNATAVYVTLQVMAGENPQEIISNLDLYKGIKTNITLEHLDENGEVGLIQTRLGYVYGGASCQSFRADVNDDKPMTINIRFNKPLHS